MVSAMGEFMTSGETAAVLRVSVGTLARLARQGVIQEAHKHPGLRGPRLFHRDEVARVAAERNLS